MSDVNVLRVAQILDKHTIVATGNASDINDGVQMLVLGEGGELPDGTPLVIPKAKLRTRANAGSYVVLENEAKTEEKEVDIPTFQTFRFSRTERIKIEVRQGLNVNEGDLSGNPGSRAIGIGDPVIRAVDFARYVAERADAKFKAKEG